MGNKKHSTIKSYRALIKNHIIPALGSKKISEISQDDIQKFCNQLAIDGHKVARLDDKGHTIKENGEIVYDAIPLSGKTIKNIYGVLTKAFTDAVNKSKSSLLPPKKTCFIIFGALCHFVDFVLVRYPV